MSKIDRYFPWLRYFRKTPRDSEFEVIIVPTPGATFKYRWEICRTDGSRVGGNRYLNEGMAATVIGAKFAARLRVRQIRREDKFRRKANEMGEKRVRL